jgi:hypothetical protein
VAANAVGLRRLTVRAVCEADDVTSAPGARAGERQPVASVAVAVVVWLLVAADTRLCRGNVQGVVVTGALDAVVTLQTMHTGVGVCSVLERVIGAALRLQA